MRLVAAHQGAGDGADDGDFRVAPKARLEQPRQFGVSVRDVAALLPCRTRGRSKEARPHTIVRSIPFACRQFKARSSLPTQLTSRQQTAVMTAQDRELGAGPTAVHPARWGFQSTRHQKCRLVAGLSLSRKHLTYPVSTAALQGGHTSTILTNATRASTSNIEQRHRPLPPSQARAS